MEANPDPLINELKKLMSYTLNYRRILKNLARVNYDNSTRDKLEEFAKVADKESETLRLLLSELDYDIDRNELDNNYKNGSWFSKPLPDSKNMQSVLAYLIEAEGNKAADYKYVLSNIDLKNEYRNQLEKHRLEAKTNIKYLMSAMKMLEHKTK